MTGAYYKKPLEDYDKSDMEKAARLRMDQFIMMNYRGNGYPNTPITNVSNDANRMDKIAYCRALWNNTLDDSRFNYLQNKVEKIVKDERTGVEDILTMEMPAKIRHIPIIRPKLHALISKEKSRPIISKVVGFDADIVDKKIERIKNDVLEKQVKKIKMKQAAQQAQQQLLAAQQQMIQQLAEDPGAQGIIMQMQAELDNLNEVVMRDVVLTQEEAKKIKQYYQYTHKEFEELLCSQALSDYIENEGLRHIFNDAFEEQMITGEPIYYCNWEPGLDRPETRHIHPEFLWYDDTSTVKFLHQLPWIVEYMPLHIEEVITYFGHQITTDELQRIRDLMPKSSLDENYRTNLDMNRPGFTRGFDSSNQQNAHLGNDIIDCYKVYWKEQVTVYALYTENDKETPYFNKKPPFVKFLTAEEAESMQSTEAKRERMKRKGQTIRKAYRVDLYEGVRIGGNIYTGIQKSSFQYRTSDRLSDVPLPYIGFANNIYHRAYSPLWETKDIQDLYDILHYQEELLIALSGVKGIIYDLSQAPEGMSPQELMYHFKQGLGLIQTIGKNGKPKRTSFNQFSTYDMTVSPAIGTIMQVKQSLSELAGEITGATRAQTGQVAATDQVGTTQIALQQSNVVTEYYFQKHEELIEQLFTRLTNIFPYAYAEGKKGAYVLGKARQEILNIQKGQLKGEFRTYVNSGSKEREIMQQAKQMAMQKYGQNEVSASQLIDMLDIDTIFEMKQKLKEYEEEAYARMQANQEQQAQQARQAQQELQQLAGQMQVQMTQMEGQIQAQLLQIKGQIEMQKEQVKAQTKAQELAFAEKKINLEAEIDKYKADTEAQIELKYLEFQYNELDVNATTTRAQMLINQAKTHLELNKSRSKEKIKD